MSTPDESVIPAAADVEGLRAYYLTGPGSVVIAWGTPGDLRRCHREVTRHTSDEPDFTSDDAWGFCNNLHKRRFGRPNDPDD